MNPPATPFTPRNAYSTWKEPLPPNDTKREFLLDGIRHGFKIIDDISVLLVLQL